jgi:hypothetical protein
MPVSSTVEPVDFPESAQAALLDSFPIAVMVTDAALRERLAQREILSAADEWAVRATASKASAWATKLRPASRERLACREPPGPRTATAG